MTSDHEPRSGTAVHTLSGRAVGHVGSVQPDAFEVKDSTRSFWLRKDAVYLADAAITTLVCELPGIAAYLVEG
ncbi:MAG: hypothetical protein IT302_09370 [Dehalococcoidia bacterium]|nr:hypothetical protein [Dehalococcoidia bacterium]